jgi:Zn-dependent protease
MAGSSITIGKFFGTDVQLHWIFVLMLLFSLFISVVPEFQDVFPFIVLLFAMVLLHEFSHTLTSKMYGIKVKKIILTPLGGASIIDLDEVPPKIALRIAVAGPLASIALAVVFGILYFYFPSGPIGSFLDIVFLLNIILGVSNILPAFPLDGGRVLKSYYEERYDQLSATRKTVKISQIILIIYILVSTVYVLYLPNVTLTVFTLLILWNVIIVMFIYGGAQSELQFAYIEKYTARLHVPNAISKDYVLVSPQTTMRQLYTILLKHGVRAVLFEKNNSTYMVSGISLGPISANNTKLLEKRVSDFAIEIPSIDCRARLSKAISRMRYEEIGVMVATKAGKIAGILFEDRVEAIIALHMQHLQSR